MREIVSARSIHITMQLLCAAWEMRNAFVLMLSEGSIGNNAKVVKDP
jgi:hypothetical protein